MPAGTAPGTLQAGVVPSVFLFSAAGLSEAGGRSQITVYFYYLSGQCPVPGKDSAHCSQIIFFRAVPGVRYRLRSLLTDVFFTAQQIRLSPQRSWPFRR